MEAAMARALREGTADATDPVTSDDAGAMLDRVLHALRGVAIEGIAAERARVREILDNELHEWEISNNVHVPGALRALRELRSRLGLEG